MINALRNEIPFPARGSPNILNPSYRGFSVPVGLKIKVPRPFLPSTSLSNQLSAGTVVFLVSLP